MHPARRNNPPLRHSAARVRGWPFTLLVVTLLATPAISWPEGSAAGANPSPATDTDGAAADLERQLGQARGEAERLRAVSADLEERLGEASAEAQALVERLATVEDGNIRLQGDLTAAQEANAALHKDLDAARQAGSELAAAATEVQRLTAALAAAEEAGRAAQQRLGETERRMSEAEGAIQRLEGERNAVEAERGRLEATLAQLHARLPASEGGALTEEQAKAHAAEAAKALSEAVRSGGRPSKAEAENRLHQAQSIVARAADARSVYRTRPQDSLALVARRFYGDGNLWVRVYQANRHVIEDPDRLVPGVTLIIP